MKQFVLPMLLLTFALTACGTTPSDLAVQAQRQTEKIKKPKANKPAPQPGTLTTLSGQVLNWTGGDAAINVTRYDRQNGTPVSIAQGHIGTSGVLSATLADDATMQTVLYPISYLDPSPNPDHFMTCASEASVSDPSANFMSMEGLSVPTDRSPYGPQLLWGTSVDEGPYSNKLQANMLLYVDRPVILNGVTDCQQQFPGSAINAIKVTYNNLSLNTGWNIVGVDASMSVSSRDGVETYLQQGTFVAPDLTRTWMVR